MTSVDWTSLHFCIMMWENNISGLYDSRSVLMKWSFLFFIQRLAKLQCHVRWCDEFYGNQISLHPKRPLWTSAERPLVAWIKIVVVWTAVGARAWKTLRVKSETFRCTVTSGLTWWFQGHYTQSSIYSYKLNNNGNMKADLTFTVMDKWKVLKPDRWQHHKPPSTRESVRETVHQRADRPTDRLRIYKNGIPTKWPLHWSSYLDKGWCFAQINQCRS